MKIRVVHIDGQQEVITLVPPVTSVEAVIPDGMSHLVDATAMEYYFNADGAYDGWGCDTHGMSLTEAAWEAFRIASIREYFGGQNARTAHA
jgi:hypothetical protein